MCSDFDIYLEGECGGWRVTMLVYVVSNVEAMSVVARNFRTLGRRGHRRQRRREGVTDVMPCSEYSPFVWCKAWCRVAQSDAELISCDAWALSPCYGCPCPPSPFHHVPTSARPFAHWIPTGHVTPPPRSPNNIVRDSTVERIEPNTKKKHSDPCVNKKPL